MGSGSSKPDSSNPFDKPLSQLANLPGDPAGPYTSVPATGARKAFLVGINYSGTRNQLNGCVNDSNLVKSYFESLGFTISYHMTDFQGGNLYPNKANIIANLTTFINSLNSGDVGYIHYSGHGSLINDSNNDELSGKDSVIVPIDYSSSGFIVDDQIRNILVTAKTGVNIFAVFDSCNSGSVCDFRYNLFDTSYRADPTVRSRIFDYNDWINRQQVYVNDKYSDTNANMISLSGSKDNQFSYEIYYNGEYHGALTISLLTILKHYQPTLKIPYLLQDLRGVLNGLQTPSLMCSNDFETDVNFSSFLKI